MRYILDDSGYIHSVSCMPFSCNDKSCAEYTGAIPDGYESIAEWAQNANIRAYKLVEGNLTFDAAKDAELQAEYNKTYKAILFEDENGSTENVTLSETSANFEYMEIFYKSTNTDYSYSSVKVYQPNGKRVDMKIFFDNGTHLYTYNENATIDGASIIRGTGNRWRFATSPGITRAEADSIAITRVVGYRWE